MLKQTIEYVEGKFREKKRELEVDEASDEWGRLSEYDRGWLFGYAAAMAAVRGHIVELDRKGETDRWRCQSCGGKFDIDANRCTECTSIYRYYDHPKCEHCGQRLED